MKLGMHVSISGGLAKAVQRAAELDCECMQIFITNPKGWNFVTRSDKEIDDFKKALQKYDIKEVFGHTIYLTNLASKNPYIYTNSVNSLTEGLVMAEKAGLAGIVTHIGSHKDETKEEGLERVTDALNQAISLTGDKVPIYLETDAGSGNHLGKTFEEIHKIISKVKSKKIGVCLDTCHIFAAGYDIQDKDKLDNVLSEFDKVIGLDRLKVIHLNDSRGELDSHVDRHEIIGEGKIGIGAFLEIVNHPKLKHLCGIVETPDLKTTVHGEEQSIERLKKLRVEKD